MVVFLVKHMFQTQVNDGTLMAIVPGALVLSAFLLPALQRNIMNAIDWFGVMLLSCMGVLCWLVWCAMTLNVPSSLARNVLRLAPEFDTSIRWWAVLIAVIMSIFWIGVVRWRVMSSKTVIWRAAVIWSAGSLMVWVLMGTLFMPWFNHVKTYKTVARDLQNALSVSQTFNHCVTPMNISLPQRSALAYFGEIQFETEYLYHIESNTVSTCDWLLTYDLDKQLNKQGLMNTVNIDPLKWRLQFEGRRFIEKNERFKLYHKIQ
jgi:4-amino-4-deoxy-L-arabinose transferase-like glycosyltransferase